MQYTSSALLKNIVFELFNWSLDQVDCYSYGVLLHEIITHERPDRGNAGPIQTPEQCPKEVDELITRCVHRDPNMRPSAAEIVEFLVSL